MAIIWNFFFIYVLWIGPIYLHHKCLCHALKWQSLESDAGSQQSGMWGAGPFLVDWRCDVQCVPSMDHYSGVTESCTHPMTIVSLDFFILWLCICGCLVIWVQVDIYQVVLPISPALVVGNTHSLLTILIFFYFYFLTFSFGHVHKHISIYLLCHVNKWSKNVYGRDRIMDSFLLPLVITIN